MKQYNLCFLGFGKVGRALARLLIAKGVITEDEYIEQLALGAEAEQRAYEARLTERFGGKTKITLV